MKRRFRHSAVLFCAMVLVVAMLAGISPASYAAPLQKISGNSSNTPVLAEKVAEQAETLGGITANVSSPADPAEETDTAEETPLKERQLKDEVMKEAETADASDASDAPKETLLPEKPEMKTAPKVSMEDILKANDPSLLLEKYDGYGFIQDTYSEYGFYDEDYTVFVTDKILYMEFPGSGCDLESYDWDEFDWCSFDWDLIEDWDDWADFGTADWDGYDDWDAYGDVFGYEPASATMVTAKNSYRLTRYDENDSKFEIDWYALPGDDGETNEPVKLFPSLDSASTLAEEIIDARMENGQLIVTTAGDAPAFCEISPLSEEIGSLITYYLDPDTLEIQALDCAVLLADGEIIPFMSQTAFYDAPDTDIFWEMVNRAAAYEFNDFENPRTVTVIYDPGTVQQEVCSRTAEKGDFLLTYFAEGYTLYQDKDGTIPFTGSDGTQDVTIYALREDAADDYFGWWMKDDSSVPPVDEGLQAIVDSGTPIDETELFAETTEEAEPGPAAITEESGSEESEAYTESVVLDAAEELDYATLSDLVYEANKLDAIFQNHESVEYSMLFDGNLLPNRIDYVYETPNTAYSETRDAAYYATRDSFYQLWLDDNVSDLYYTFDFVNNYDPLRNAGYEIVPNDIRVWWNSDCETPLYAYEADGMIYMASEFDEDLSREFFGQWMDEEYAGQTVSTLMIVKPESYEILALIYSVTDQDGQESAPLIFSVNYDVPEPRACRNLRATAERSAEQSAELSIIMNPGTDSEKIESMKVPIGSTVIYVADSGMSLYLDEDGTVPASRWDHVSDMVYYLIAD